MLAAMLGVLYGCSQTEEKTGGDGMPEEYQFVKTNVGKSSDEVKNLIGKDWEDTSALDSQAKRFQDADGNQYVFHNDRLTAVQYVYEDAEQGFQKCRDIYTYICDAYGEEREDNVREEDATLKDITTLDEFQSLGGERNPYQAVSNWFFTEDPSQWECISGDEMSQSAWEGTGGRPVLILDMQMADNRLSVNIGYSGVPKV